MNQSEILHESVSVSLAALILAILKQAENGVPVAELCREHGMSSAAKTETSGLLAITRGFHFTHVYARFGE